MGTRKIASCSCISEPMQSSRLIAECCMHHDLAAWAASAWADLLQHTTVRYASHLHQVCMWVKIETRNTRCFKTGYVSDCAIHCYSKPAWQENVSWAADNADEAARAYSAVCSSDEQQFDDSSMSSLGSQMCWCSPDLEVAKFASQNNTIQKALLLTNFPSTVLLTHGPENAALFLLTVSVSY